MRVILHGFGSFPVFFYHVIQRARQIAAPIEWAIVLTSDHHKDLFVPLLGEENVLICNRPGSMWLTDANQRPYPGQLFHDIAAEKRNFKNLSVTKQYDRAVGLFGEIDAFMGRFSPTHALVSQVEGFDGKAFIAAARSHHATVVVPTSCRNIGGIYFSEDDCETFPVYANDREQKNRDLAKKFIDGFRTESVAAHWLPDLANEKILDTFQKPLAQRMVSSFRRWSVEPNGFQLDYLRTSLLNNLPHVRNFIWAVRRTKNQGLYNAKINDLPERFIYYPLQYTPESSINTPAPYFLDQTRAIDAIRFSMPSDYKLVVKEHPACVRMRDGTFVKKLLKTPGVIVVDYKTPSVDLSKRAAITISVTGTATLEAHFLGRPALVLGKGISAELIGGVTSVDALSEKIQHCLTRKVSDEDVISSVAKVYSARYEVAFGSIGHENEPILREGNIERFTSSFIEHCIRLGQ
jgi:hypothetical protein